MNKYLFVAILFGMMSVGLSSCLNDDDDKTVDYTEWRKTNEAYLATAAAKTDETGQPYFEKLVPSFATGTYTLIHWYNDRALTAKNLTPFDNSIVDIKYETLDIDDTMIDNSYSLRTYGDSIYRTYPSSMVYGVREALTHMHVGDSVNLVMPASAAYGMYQHGTIKPYSTLKFNIKLVGVPAYEIPKVK